MIRGPALALVGFGLLGGIGLVMTRLPAEPRPLTIEFRALGDGAPLVFDDARYENPGGAGRFKVSAFRFYVSNIRLEGERESHSIPDSYHLIRFEQGRMVSPLVLERIPLAQIDRLSLSIGVDETANNSIEQVGDLDPNSRMAWNWEIGYKFVLLEGAFESAERRLPIVYHVGFSENRRDLAFRLDPPIVPGSDARLALDVEMLNLFRGAYEVDLSVEPSVTVDREASKRIADNYAGLISLSE